MPYLNEQGADMVLALGASRGHRKQALKLCQCWHPVTRLSSMTIVRTYEALKENGTFTMKQHKSLVFGEEVEKNIQSKFPADSQASIMADDLDVEALLEAPYRKVFEDDVSVAAAAARRGAVGVGVGVEVMDATGVEVVAGTSVGPGLGLESEEGAVREALDVDEDHPYLPGHEADARPFSSRAGHAAAQRVASTEMQSSSFFGVRCDLLTRLRKVCVRFASVMVSRGTYRPPDDLKKKVEILREVENSVLSKTEIAKKYDITKSSLSIYIKNKEYHRWI
ncbi:hypothetical protein HPB50_012869 [Hyalomma asiaticum]|uniref:Uncharacterized protein n=1 Tax=Hyalomma asiaticum TaxID=266040 RepID=A0ACB7TH27_HYAAI|nr:hypothetical protein HPB50_012869 [Hyalomma asiaticum]